MFMKYAMISSLWDQNVGGALVKHTSTIPAGLKSKSCRLFLCAAET